MAMRSEDLALGDNLSYVNDVLAGVDEEDRTNITKFAIFLDDFIKINGLNEGYNIFTLLDVFGVYDLGSLNKEGSCLQAIWVIFLRIMRKNLENDNLFKYKSMTEFLASYDGEFDNIETSEQVKLFHTANWMTILFRMVSAKKNKGLAVHVIPKLVEGFNVKYITGSGQTKSTADRVLIFEHEGNVKPFQRGKWKNNEEIKKSMGAGGGITSISKRVRKAVSESGLGMPTKRIKSNDDLFEQANVGAPLEFGRDRSIDSVDFTECLKLLRTNSQSAMKTLDFSDSTSAPFERNKSIDSVDFAECLKLLRGNSYSTRPPELSRDWSSNSLGFLTDSLLQPPGSESYSFSFDKNDNDGLNLLNEAAQVSSTLPVNDSDFDFSSYNQLLSGPPVIKRSTSLNNSWISNVADVSPPTNDVKPAGSSKPI